MPKRRSQKQTATQDHVLVDWTILTPEVLEVIAKALQPLDLANAASVCKAWREALLALLVRKLRVVLADVLVHADQARTRRDQGRFINITKLLSYAAYDANVELVVTERRRPSDAQVQALLAALAPRPAVKKLCIRVVKQIDNYSPKQTSELARFIELLCAQIADSTHPLASLDIFAPCNAKPQHLAPISSSLAQLPNLQHLLLEGDSISLHHLAPITSSLTNLTSLELHIPHASTYMARPTPNSVLNQLTSLMHLETLTLVAAMRQEPLNADVVLPPLPHLKHLRFQDKDGVITFQVLLSAEHCARLESLQVPGFHVVAGVTSMDTLQRLELHRLQAIQLHAIAPLHDASWTTLQYPQLQHFGMLGLQGFGGVLQQMVQMLQLAPAVNSIDMQCLMPSQLLNTVDNQLLLHVLASSQTPLRSFLLPAHWQWGCSLDAQLVQQLLALAAQQGKLQQLVLQSTIPAEQHAVLRSITSLRDLDIAHTTPSLPQLPPELTALTLNVTNTSAPLPRKPAKAQALPLRRLRTNHPAAVLQALCMRQLSSSLTSLQFQTGHALTAAAAWSISQLKHLAELQCPPWAGMVQQLAGLAQLRSLVLCVEDASDVEIIERQVGQLGVLAQLRELVLERWLHNVTESVVREVVGKVERVLPRCMVMLRRT